MNEIHTTNTSDACLITIMMTFCFVALYKSIFLQTFRTLTFFFGHCFRSINENGWPITKGIHSYVSKRIATGKKFSHFTLIMMNRTKKDSKWKNRINFFVLCSVYSLAHCKTWCFSNRCLMIFFSFFVVGLCVVSYRVNE